MALLFALSWFIAAAVTTGLSTFPTTAPTSFVFTISPSASPTLSLSDNPTEIPFKAPSAVPSFQPRRNPSSNPSMQPSCRPTSMPSGKPTMQPSVYPSDIPSRNPSSYPNGQPTSIPSVQPSSSPTSVPTVIPPCRAGTYYYLTGRGVSNDPSASYECRVCPAGSFSSKIYSSTCELCPPGQFSRENSTSCTVCPLNTYAEKNGTALQCDPCKPGEVTGITGATSSDECIIIYINFSSGGLALIASAVIIFVYIFKGRLHYVAFQRKFRLVRKCVIMYEAMLTTVDMVHRAGTLLDVIISGNEDDDESAFTLKNFMSRIVKPFVLFPLICLIVTITIIVLHVTKSSFRVVFNAMVLWRAYRRLSIINFSDVLKPFLVELGNVLFSHEYIQWVAYPVVFVLDAVSGWRINLTAYEVVCPGPQKPLYLLLDLIIAGVVVFVIESEVQVFWTMMIESAAGKIQGLFLNYHYIRGYLCSTGIFLALATAVTYFPDPSMIVQYCMGFVVVSKFINFDADTIQSVIPTRKNCNNVLPIPMDSILGYSAALFAVIVLPVVIYTLSGVLLPVKHREDTLNAANSPTVNRDEADSGCSEYDSSDGGSDVESTEITSRSSHKAAASARSKRSSRKRTRSGVASPSSPISTRASADSDKQLGVHTFRGSRNQELSGASEKTAFGVIIRVLRVLPSFFAMDWFILKMVFNLGINVFHLQRKFIAAKYMIYTPQCTYNSTTNTYDTSSGNKHKKAYEDAFEYDNDLKEIRKSVTHAKMPSLPWFDGLVVVDDAAVIKERKKEKRVWHRVEAELPNYLTMVAEVREEMSESKTFQNLPWVHTWLCYFLPAQIFLTTSGQQHWFRVLKTYFGILLVCLNVWPEWIVQDFDLLHKFDEFNKLNHVIYRQISGKIFSSNFNRREDAFTKIDNDEGLSFGQYVASITVCRIALLQLVPLLTVWTLFAIAVAAHPLIVVSETMGEKLHQPFVKDPYRKAYDLLKEDYGREPSRLQVWFLGYYLLVNQSRIIQFFVNGFLYGVSVGIIFFPEYLSQLVAPMVAVMLHQGLLAGLYVSLLVKKLLFPIVSEISPADSARSMALVDISTLSDDERISDDDYTLVSTTPPVGSLFMRSNTPRQRHPAATPSSPSLALSTGPPEQMRGAKHKLI